MSALPSIFAADPAVRMLQLATLSGGGLILFLLFWTVKDIMVRTKSFALQLLSILLVTVLPFFGFLVYLLVRPKQTLFEKEMMALLKDIKRDLHQKNGTAKPVKKKE